MAYACEGCQGFLRSTDRVVAAQQIHVIQRQEGVEEVEGLRAMWHEAHWWPVDGWRFVGRGLVSDFVPNADEGLEDLPDLGE